MATRRVSQTPFGLLVFLALAIFLLLQASSSPAPTLASRVEQDAKRDVARFTPQNSLDISMAMGLTTYDTPRMLNPPGLQPLQLLFPPSATDLEKLCGI